MKAYPGRGQRKISEDSRAGCAWYDHIHTLEKSLWQRWREQTEGQLTREAKPGILEETRSELRQQ